MALSPFGYLLVTSLFFIIRYINYNWWVKAPVTPDSTYPYQGITPLRPYAPLPSPPPSAYGGAYAYRQEQERLRKEKEKESSSTPIKTAPIDQKPMVMLDFMSHQIIGGPGGNFNPNAIASPKILDTYIQSPIEGGILYTPTKKTAELINLKFPGPENQYIWVKGPTSIPTSIVAPKAMNYRDFGSSRLASFAGMGNQARIQELAHPISIDIVNRAEIISADLLKTNPNDPWTRGSANAIKASGQYFGGLVGVGESMLNPNVPNLWGVAFGSEEQLEFMHNHPYYNIGSYVGEMAFILPGAKDLFKSSMNLGKAKMIKVADYAEIPTKTSFEKIFEVNNKEFIGGGVRTVDSEFKEMKGTTRFIPKSDLEHIAVDLQLDAKAKPTFDISMKGGKPFIKTIDFGSINLSTASAKSDLNVIGIEAKGKYGGFYSLTEHIDLKTKTGMSVETRIASFPTFTEAWKNIMESKSGLAIGEMGGLDFKEAKAAGIRFGAKDTPFKPFKYEGKGAPMEYAGGNLDSLQVSKLRTESSLPKLSSEAAKSSIVTLAKEEHFPIQATGVKVKTWARAVRDYEEFDFISTRVGQPSIDLSIQTQTKKVGIGSGLKIGAGQGIDTGISTDLFQNSKVGIGDRMKIDTTTKIGITPIAEIGMKSIVDLKITPLAKLKITPDVIQIGDIVQKQKISTANIMRPEMFANMKINPKLAFRNPMKIIPTKALARQKFQWTKYSNPFGLGIFATEGTMMGRINKMVESDQL